MTAGLLRDFAILALAAAAPAAFALVLLRRGLASRGRPYWRAASLGLLALAALAVLAIWGATVFAEQEIATCRAADNPAFLDCEDNGLWVAIAGMPAVGALVIFILGAAGFRIVRLFRRER